MPNARATENIDLRSLSSGIGVSASVLMYKQGLLALDIACVNIDHYTYGGMAISTNLNQWHFLNIQYAWLGLINTDISVWIGMDLKEKVTSYGVSASLVKFSK